MSKKFQRIAATVLVIVAQIEVGLFAGSLHVSVIKTAIVILFLSILTTYAYNSIMKSL